MSTGFASKWLTILPKGIWRSTTKPGIGIWLIGAKGGVASTTIVGLADWNDFVVGGHEIRHVRLADEAMRLPPWSWTSSDSPNWPGGGVTPAC